MKLTPKVARPFEEDPSLAVDAVVGALRAVEWAAVVLAWILVSPLVGAMVFSVVAPVLAIALILWILAAVIWTPYVLIRHFRGERGDHVSLVAHRLRHAARALLDLMPHRIVADARTEDPCR